MYEWEVHYSDTKKKGTRISCETWIAYVFADDEEEVRKSMAEAHPGKSIDRIIRYECVDDA
jgi:hypothetical protein